ncbi:MAG: lysozyme inhibitor LprI family protein [Cyanobium sp.]
MAITLAVQISAGALLGLLVTGGAPVLGMEDSLQRSQEQIRSFPFTPNCAGNTQEMVACLWERRNQVDATLGEVLKDAERLEQWRTTRRGVCEIAAAKAKGGSVYPIVWLSCENTLNKALLRQLRKPLLQSADL